MAVAVALRDEVRQAGLSNGVGLDFIHLKE